MVKIIKKFEKGQKIHMVGVSGIGMSALAAFLVDKGCKVTGSDLEKSKDVPKGVKFVGEQDEKNIKKGIDVVIISHAIPYDNPELKKARDLELQVLTYPEAVGILTSGYKLVSICGTHGKSTTTAMLAKILIDSGHDPSVIVGTRVDSLGGKNFRIGKSKLFLLESCEYNEAFLNYHPEVVVVTNIEPDHLDYYKTEANYFKAFKKYLKNLKKGGTVVMNADDKPSREVLEKCRGKKIKISLKDREKLDLKVIGHHNQTNAWQAVETAKALGVSEDVSKKVVQEFEGTWRRLEHRGQINGADVYDDYAHHPTEIELTLKALKRANPRKHIVCVFQPHQYSRTIELFDGFIDALQEAYVVIIPNIYRVRDTEDDVAQVDVDMLVEAINDYEGIDRAINGEGFENTADLLKKDLDSGDICVIMGAGDIAQLCDMLV